MIPIGDRKRVADPLRFGSWPTWPNCGTHTSPSACGLRATLTVDYVLAPHKGTLSEYWIGVAHRPRRPEAHDAAFRRGDSATSARGGRRSASATVSPPAAPPPVGGWVRSQACPWPTSPRPSGGSSASARPPGPATPLGVAVSGPFGLEHAEVADIAFAADPLDDAREDVRLAINNSLNMLTGYPHLQVGRVVRPRLLAALLRCGASSRSGQGDADPRAVRRRRVRRADVTPTGTTVCCLPLRAVGLTEAVEAARAFYYVGGVHEEFDWEEVWRTATGTNDDLVRQEDSSLAKRSGNSHADVATAVGIGLPWYYDVEAHDDEITTVLSLRPASPPCAHPRRGPCGNSWPRTTTSRRCRPERLGLADLADRLRSRVNAEGAASVEETRSGGGLSTSMADPAAAWGEPVDFRRFVSEFLGSTGSTPYQPTHL